MFGTLLYFGGQIYQAKPPIPTAVEPHRARTLFTRAQIERGQNVWQSHGRHAAGLDLGPRQLCRAGLERRLAASRSARAARAARAGSESGAPTPRSPSRIRRACGSILQQEMRTNTYDRSTGAVTVSDAPRAGDRVGRRALFATCSGNDARGAELARAVRISAQRHAAGRAKREALNAFFFWTAWAATTNRPGETITYTSNWPHEPLVGNTPTGVDLHVDVHLDLRAARRHRRARLVLREGVRHLAARRRAGDGVRAQDFMDAAIDHAVDARDRLVLLGRRGAVRRAGAARHRHRALCGRRPGPLRPAAVGISSRIRSPAPGTPSSPCSGSRRPGSRPGLYVAPLLGGREPKFQAAGRVLPVRQPCS